MAGEQYANVKGLTLPSGKVLAALGACSGMSLLSVCEVMVLIFTRFRSYRGLYFWSMLTATTGAFLFNLATVLYFYTSSSPAALSGFSGISTVGYLLYVPSEFLVLYSRLHLVLVSPRKIRLIFLLLASEFCLVAIPNAVLAAGALIGGTGDFWKIYPIWQRMEVCIYTATEITISTIYIIQVFRVWGTDVYPHARRIFMHLIWVNGFIILLDSGNVAMAFTGNAPLQTAWIGFVYAFKLKVEFWILNQLTRMSHRERLGSHDGATVIGSDKSTQRKASVWSDHPGDVQPNNTS